MQTCTDKYHHSCYLKYSNSKFARVKENRKCSAEKYLVSNDNTSNILKKITLQSIDILAREVKLMCCFCLKNDDSNKLVAAGTLHATMTKTKAMHVQNLTDEWKTMAAASNCKHLLNQLSSGDVTSN